MIAIGDVSVPVAALEFHQKTPIEDPFLFFDAHKENGLAKSYAEASSDSVLYYGVSNAPAELARDASDMFSSTL